MHEGIIAISADGTIININQSANNILELEEEMRGKHISRLFPELDPQTLLSSSGQYYEQILEYKLDGLASLLLACNIT